MAIERHTFKEPLLVSSKRPLRDQIAAGLLAGGDITSLVLPAEEYDLTPNRLTPLKYLLLVRPEGNGILTIKPRLAVASADISGGETIWHIPENGRVRYVPSPARSMDELFIYEVLFHKPGPSPIR
jgi:hypothetical protein